MYQYILFDLDGTLTDSAEGITKSVQYALGKMGIIENNLEKLQPFVGPPLLESFQEYYGLNQEDGLKAITYFRERFETIGIFENALYPGIKEMLKTLKKQGKINAVASSKPEVFVKRILKHFEIEQYFDVVVGGTLDETRVSKEAVVEEALKQLNDTDYCSQPNSDNCVMVGDRKFDIQGAKEHNLRSIGVKYGFAPYMELEEAGADVIAETVEELTNVLLTN